MRNYEKGGPYTIMSLGDFLTQCPGRAINPVVIITITLFTSIESLHCRQGAKLDIFVRWRWPRVSFLILGGERVLDGLRGYNILGLSRDGSSEFSY